jgi:hypothetical protein
VTNSPITVSPASYSDATSGVYAFAWSSGDAEVSFSPSDSASTTVSSSAASGVTDYSCSITVTDRAGNSSAPDSFTLRWDKDPPNSPTASLNVGDTITSPQTLVWTMNSGGSPDSEKLEGSYNGGKWISISDGDTYTVSSRTLVSGMYRLRVREYDTAGNVSYSAYESTSYFPETALTPSNGAIKVSISTNLGWASFAGADGYYVYIREQGASSYSRTYITKTTTSSLRLSTLITYEWYYQPVEDLRFTKRVIATSPVWTFTTGTLRF